MTKVRKNLTNGTHDDFVEELKDDLLTAKSKRAISRQHSLPAKLINRKKKRLKSQDSVGSVGSTSVDTDDQDDEVVFEPRRRTGLFCTFVIVCMYLCAAAGCIFNMVMVLPNEADLYVNYARMYQLALCVPLYAGTMLSMTYLWERKSYVARRDHPIHVSGVQLLVIIWMTIFIALGYLLYFVPYTFVFWNCDYAIQTDNSAEKLADLLFYVGTCSYMLVTIIYSLQRTRLASDKETKNRHDFEHFLKCFNRTLMILLFIKVVVDKVYVVYRDMVCPNVAHRLVAPIGNHSGHHAGGTTIPSHGEHHRFVRRSGHAQPNHTSILSIAAEHPTGDDHLYLNICNGVRKWQCDVHEVNQWAEFFATLDRKLIRPFLYVITAEIIPLIYCLHANSTSSKQWKVRPESPVARFHFHHIRSWLVNYVYTSVSLFAVPFGLIILMARMYVVGSTAHEQPTRVQPELDICRNIYYILRFVTFLAIWLSLFRRHPRRYVKHTPWYKLKLRNSFKTPLVQHAAFDSSIIMFTMTIKVVMVVGDTIIVLSRGVYTLFDLAELAQMLSMITEWMVLRNMLILNNSELKQWPLHNRTSVSLGPILSVAGIALGYFSFIEEFVKHVFSKLTLAHAQGPLSSLLLSSVLMTETLYFGVSLYYFTMGTCWLELFHRYINLDAYSLGHKPKHHQRPRSHSSTGQHSVAIHHRQPHHKKNWISHFV